jgi:putative ABC transport system permease protein
MEARIGSVPALRHARLAVRNLARQRVRTGVTLGAIAFGVAALILTGGFVQDIFVQLGEALIHSQSGHLQVAKAGFFDGGARAPERYLLAEPAPLRARIAELPGVADTLGRLNFSGLLSNGRSDLSIVGQGVEPEREARLGTSLRMVAGRPLAEHDRFGIVVGAGVAEALQLAVGDRVVLLVNTPQGALNTVDFDLVGVFQTFTKEFDDRAVRTSLDTARELLDSPGTSTIVVALEQTGHTNRVARALRDRLDSAGVDVRTWVELNDFYEKTVALYDRQFGVLQLIVLIMVVLSVANSVNMSAFERTGEFGTLLALGNRRRDVFALIVTENLILGLAGAATGLVLGTAAAMLISAIGIPMPPPPNANVGFTARVPVVGSVLATAFAVGVAATVLASFLPAWRLSRLPIVDALRENV